MNATDARLRKVSADEAIARIIAARNPKACGVCGRRALYRLGFAGRCDEHRMVPDVKDQQHKRMIEARRASFEQDAIAFDRAMRRRTKWRRKGTAQR